MSTTTTHWFSPNACEFSSSRISLDFGLRSADQFFRELVVPEIGRVWFVRQISWPLAALVIHEELESQNPSLLKPTAISHGIEALACKLEYYSKLNGNEKSKRILGSRAFGRDSGDGLWTFSHLQQSKNYVVNTHRQAATRALLVDGGLGFVNGSRFDLYKLEPVGRALANAFLDQRVGKGGSTLRKWLRGWLEGDVKRDAEVSRWPKSLRVALSPEYPSPEECSLVRSRLLETSSDAGEIRRRLAASIGRAKALRDIEGDVIDRLCKARHDKQAADILAARAFGAVLDRARDAVSVLTSDRLGIGRHPVRLTVLATDNGIRESLKNLREASKSYITRTTKARVNEPTSRAFANAVSTDDDVEAIRLIVHRAGQILGLADGAVFRGPLFRVINATDETNIIDDGTASIEPDRTGRTYRIANLHSLLRDLDSRGAR